MSATSTASETPQLGLKPRVLPRLDGRPFVGNLYEARTDTLSLVERAAELGDIVHIPVLFEQLYLINDPDAIGHVMSARPDIYSREENLEVPHFKHFLGSGPLSTTGAAWRKARAPMESAFQHDLIDAMAERFTTGTERAMEWFQQGIRPGQSVDVFPRMMSLTTTAIMQAFLNFPFNRRRAFALVDAIIEGQEHVLYRIKNPLRLPDFLPLPRYRRFRQALATARELMDEAVASRRGERADDGVEDLLEVLLTSTKQKGEGGLSPQEMRDQLMTLFVSGPESLASTLTWTMTLLSDHPRMAQSARAEVTSVLGTRIPTIRDLPRLTLVNQILAESMRLLPAAPILTRRVLQNDEILGYPIPARSVVLVSPWVIHRHRQWWTDPTAFQPERFAGSDAIRHKYAYIPLGAGDHKCVAESAVWRLLPLALAMILQRFEMRRDLTRPVERKALVNLRPRTGVWMYVNKRG